MVADDLARIERLIEEILDYARYMKPKFSSESVNEIVVSCLHFIEVKAATLGVTIEKHLEEPLAPIMVDRQQMKQVFMNLILNAMDAMKERDGRLTVATRHLTRLDGTKWVQIEVSDNGCGISPEDLPHIFDRFYRADKSRARKVGGAGLGLAIAKQAIESSHGTITCESAVGSGTTFTVRLPATAELPVDRPRG